MLEGGILGVAGGKYCSWSGNMGGGDAKSVDLGR